MDFFQEFEKLRMTIPRLALVDINGENDTLCNFVYKNKNCMGCAGSDYLENCLHCYWCYHCTECTDCSYSYDCVSCFECLDCRNCYECSSLQDCKNLTNCHFCFDCQDLEDCFACVGLWRKRYCIFNKQYTAEHYKKIVEKLQHRPCSELMTLFKEVRRFRPHVFMRELYTRNSTGDYLINTTNCYACFDTKDARDSMYLNNAINLTNCCDVAFAGEPPLDSCYEIMSGMGLRNCMFCSTCWYGENLEYCDQCFDCRNCFGCAGLKNKEYYVLNTQYSPREYGRIVDTIKRDMKQRGAYGMWFSSTYPLKDTPAAPF